MDGIQIISTIFLVLMMVFVQLLRADHEYMITSAESITVPFDYETKLQCIMNIEPDKFQWKFYPLNAKDAFNPKAVINLSTSNFINVPLTNFTVQRRQSELTVQVDSKQIAGDYQCLAYYGASVVASIPWRITIVTLGDFPKQDKIDITVLNGSTVNWRCEPPESNPEAYIDYYKNDIYINPTNLTPITKSLILPNINLSDSGKYTCRAINTLQQKRESNVIFNLKVVKTMEKQSPKFIQTPKTFYNVNKGDTVFLECSAIGNPIPRTFWLKKNGELPTKRVQMVSGGLIIKNITSNDDGVYICNHTNSLGGLSHHITLVYNEEPTIDCILNSTDVRQGENLDLDCTVNGTPEPQITWFLNGYSVGNDSAIEAIGNKIYFRPVEKRHAGNLQMFARNLVKTVYSTISIKVIPLSTSIDVIMPSPTRAHHRHNNNNNNNNNNHYGSKNGKNGKNGSNSRKAPKHLKMIPPTKPIISRESDESVVVRWSVPANKGLPIQFFKIQYRELGPVNQTNDQHNTIRNKNSRWKTRNDDIRAFINSFVVDNLKSNHIYKFRIAAVYSNNDNKLSPNSDKFYLMKLDFDDRNLLPVPLITGTETINSTAVQIYWKHTPQLNITIDGFFINYISASSAADYMKATADGEHVTSAILSHLQPDTIYDIKLQSFTSKTVSEYSSIMKAKTLPIASTPSPSTNRDSTTISSSNMHTNGSSNLYIIIAIGLIIVCALIGSSIALLLYCRKWKQNKNTTTSGSGGGGTSGGRDRDKPSGDHLPIDGNEYVVSPKSLQTRSNGCVQSNRITITANPLADADNKNQNMIEMSCLSSQNNNCTTAVPAAVASAATADDAVDQEQEPTISQIDEESKSRTDNKKIKNKRSNIRSKKQSNETIGSGENYV